MGGKRGRRGVRGRSARPSVRRAAGAIAAEGGSFAPAPMAGARLEDQRRPPSCGLVGGGWSVAHCARIDDAGLRAARDPRNAGSIPLERANGASSPAPARKMSPGLPSAVAFPCARRTTRSATPYTVAMSCVMTTDVTPWRSRIRSINRRPPRD